MYTPSTSSPFSFIQPLNRDLNSEANQHSTEKGVENKGHQENHGNTTHGSNNIHNRLAKDVYESSQTEIAGTVSSKIAVQTIASSLSESSEIKITTKEGDEIKISFSQSAASSRSAFQIKQGNSQISAYTENDSFEANFSITVEGNLNEDEQKSLKDLIKKLDNVSNEFFSGDVKSAFKHAQKVGFDTSQIASFSLDLNREKTVQAVTAYQQTTIPDQNINKDQLIRASDFLASTKAYLADTRSALESLAEPRQAYTDLLTQIGQLNNTAQETSEDQQQFKDIIKHIGDDLFANKNNVPFSVHDS